MTITVQKTNRPDHFNLYTALKISGSRCLQHTMRVKANSRLEALSLDNVAEFIKYVYAGLPDKLIKENNL
jgi:hypothetical protein